MGMSGRMMIWKTDKGVLPAFPYLCAMARRTTFSDLIIKETGDYLIVNKPPLISTLEDRSSGENMLLMAREYEPEAQVCHRLDKETSGVLVIARNPEAYRHMSLQLQERKVDKVYHAVVEGLHDFRDEVVTAPIRKNASGGVTIDFREGKEAETRFTTQEVFKKHTLVECRPLSGRMHQIRIHLAFLKAPIIADHAYGGSDFFLSEVKRHYNLKKGQEEQPLIKRIALHAWHIRFEIPEGDIIEAWAPYPKDFRVLLTQLERNR